MSKVRYVAPFFFFYFFFLFFFSPPSPRPTFSWPGRDGHKRALDAEQWCCPHALSATSADSPSPRILLHSCLQLATDRTKREKQQQLFPFSRLGYLVSSTLHWFVVRPPFRVVLCVHAVISSISAVKHNENKNLEQF